MAMSQYLFLIPGLPLLAFVINLLFGRFLRTNAFWIATPAVFASFILSLLVFQEISATGHGLRQDLYTWIQAGDFHVGINLVVDQLTAVMLLVVTSVGFLVHVVNGWLFAFIYAASNVVRVRTRYICADSTQ